MKSRHPENHSGTGGRIITPSQNRILNAAEAILQDPHVSDQDRAFIARQVVQVTLPHADPGDVPVWKRSNGFLTLSIRPGWDHDRQLPARLSLRHAAPLAALLADDRGGPHQQPPP